MIQLKNQQQINYMSHAGIIVRDVLNLLEEKTIAGVSTLKLNNLAYDYIIKNKAVPSFLGYNGFPQSICVSINNEVVHGIPSASRIIKDGDIVSVDAGACFFGYHADAARTYCVGNVSQDDKQLVEVTRECFFQAYNVLQNGVRLGDIGFAVSSYAEKFGYGVVRDLAGHGIGAKLHEDPSIPNFGVRGRGLRIFDGTAIAIEPMINAGSYKVEFCQDGWTVITNDGSKSAHYENTVLLIDGERKILTL